MGIIKLPKESVKYFEENFKEIFESGNLAEGKWSDEVANWTRSYTSAKFSLAVNSNGAGILALLHIFKNFEDKKYIFIQSNTMYGVKTMALTSGLNLLGFVDCSLDYLMPTYKQVETFIESIVSPHETIFLLTHIGGWVNPDIEKISKLCKNKGVTLIEDCAHSLGSTLNNKHTGLFGDAGVYSLYATKAVPAGEGGIVVTNDKKLFERIKRYVIYDRFDQKLDLGVNIRMSEISALLSLSVLKEIDSILENKYLTSEKYVSACEENGWHYIKPLANGQRSNLYKFIILSRATDPVEEFKKIKTRTSCVYDYTLGEDFDGVAKRHICLPIWYQLEDQVINKVICQLTR